MITGRLRRLLAAAALGLFFQLAFADSLALAPLRVLAGWPGEVGRALGGLATSSQLGALALSQAAEVQLPGATAAARAVIALCGLATQLAASLALLWLSTEPPTSPLGPPSARRFFGAAAGAALIAAAWPPITLSNPATFVDLGAALGCAWLWFSRTPAARQVSLLLLFGTMASGPLAELRSSWLSVGRPLGSIAALELATGVAASAWALLATDLSLGGAILVLRRRDVLAFPNAEPVTELAL